MLQTIDILQDLIRIPSFVDETHDESKLGEYVENFLRTQTKFKYVTQLVEGSRKNILVFNKPNPKIALFGHLDTVLPKTETDKPFEPRVEGDKLFGLGSVDMKSGLAIMLKLAAEIESDELAFVFSVDEEYDFKGAMKLKEITDFKPEFIINVEPSDVKILNGCRGITEFSFKVQGKSAHAGRKEMGINAIEKAIEITNILQKNVSELDVVDGGKSSVNLAYIHGGILKGETAEKVEVVGMGNVVPNYAEVVCEIRIANPKIDKDLIEFQINKIAEDIGVGVVDFKFKFYLGSMLTSKTDLAKFEESVKEVCDEVVYSNISLAGYFEVQMLQESWGSKSVVFGASLAGKSHMSDEYVEISSLEKVEKVLRDYIDKRITE